ncbi:MAG: amino-acid N-acetyltransferase [Pseudomonadales bacterium]|nr:amino-acid N-acetyltransferase [Pseudomonadales bacterium]
MPDVNQYVNWFRQSSPYINALRDNTVVVMLSGDTIKDPNFDNVIHDIALLNSLGIRLVLVYGARVQIEDNLTAQGLSSNFHHCRRITDAATLNCAVAASGSIRTSIEAKLSMGLINTPMHGARIRLLSGNFVTARPVGIFDGVDLCHTGEVRRIDHRAIKQALKLDSIVLLSTIGYSPTGELFNLPVEEVAAQAAISLEAHKLILFGSEQGITDSNGDTRSELLSSTAQRLLNQYRNQLSDPNQTPSEVSQLLATAIKAVDGGVPRCHLLSYKVDGAMLAELYTRDGSGTMITEESYEQIRDAGVEDIGGIIELINPLEENGTLVRRSRERLEAEIEQFIVIERDNAIIACAALYCFAEEQIGELACIAVAEDYLGGNRGDVLLKAIQQRALARGLNSLFVLTTRTAHWFLEQGFSAITVEQLPKQKQRLYNLQRNSKVFCKQLTVG